MQNKAGAVTMLDASTQVYDPIAKILPGFWYSSPACFSARNAPLPHAMNAESLDCTAKYCAISILHKTKGLQVSGLKHHASKISDGVTISRLTARTKLRRTLEKQSSCGAGTLSVCLSGLYLLTSLTQPQSTYRVSATGY